MENRSNREIGWSFFKLPLEELLRISKISSLSVRSAQIYPQLRKNERYIFRIFFLYLDLGFKKARVESDRKLGVPTCINSGTIYGSGSTLT